MARLKLKLRYDMTNYSVLREELKLKPTNGISEDLAFVTHFLHNYSKTEEKFYKDRAVEYFDQYAEKVNFDSIFPIKWNIPFPRPNKIDFTFIDLFAGIGGFRVALQEIGGSCVFSSENNKYAQETYELNFGEVPFGDITKIDLKRVPKHDILCAGFPCQPFSISGKMKGFEDTRGALIYYVFSIIEKIKPKVVLLENVKHLVYHNKGNTLATIIKHLQELGYKISKKVLNASNFGVPQNRERIIIVGHKNKLFDFERLPPSTNNKVVLKDFLDTKGSFDYLDEPYTILNNQKRQDSGLIFAGYRNKKIRVAGVRKGTEHLSRVHKQPNRIYSTEGIHPALPSQESSGRFWIWHDSKVRKLTIDECYRIMGFPEKFKFIDSKSELYKQIGNSVAVPMIKAIGEEIKRQLL